MKKTISFHRYAFSIIWCRTNVICIVFIENGTLYYIIKESRIGMVNNLNNYNTNHSSGSP